MDLRNAILEEFTFESQLTKRVIEATPDSLLKSQPSKSGHTVGWNISHLADIPSWCGVILTQSEFDVTTEPPPPEADTIADAINLFDTNVAAATKVIETFDLETLEDPWTLRAGDQVLLTQSRYMIYRMFEINHIAHHRGHVLAYLRVADVEVPLLYG